MLSHYALTMYLLPCMTRDARIVETTSIAQLTGKKLDAEDMDLKDWLMDRRGYAHGDRLNDCDNKVVCTHSVLSLGRMWLTMWRGGQTTAARRFR